MFFSPNRIDVGDRLKLYDGYDSKVPSWLCGKEFHVGTVIAFIPGQSQELAAVVKLNEAVQQEGITGDIVILEHSYYGAKLKSAGIVHVELCDFEPESKPWSQRRRGKWIESHASYSII